MRVMRVTGVRILFASHGARWLRRDQSTNHVRMRICTIFVSSAARIFISASSNLVRCHRTGAVLRLKEENHGHVHLTDAIHPTGNREDQSPARLAAARKAFEQPGAKIKDFYLVSGQYDAIVITEALDDTAVVKVSLALASRGNVRTETLRAFTEEEFRKIVNALP
jgi:uncharacterized protein with GYD domain